MTLEVGPPDPLCGQPVVAVVDIPRVKSCGTTTFGISWSLRARPRGAPPQVDVATLTVGLPVAQLDAAEHNPLQH